MVCTDCYLAHQCLYRSCIEKNYIPCDNCRTGQTPWQTVQHSSQRKTLMRDDGETLLWCCRTKWWYWRAGTAHNKYVSCCCVVFYKTTSGCIYLQKLVDVIPNKGTPLVSLALHIKLVKAFVQNTIVGSFGVVKPFLEDSLKIMYLTFLLYYN